MGAGTLISVEEYLNTAYDPDVEYVDGVLVERNVGDWIHSLVQRNLIVALSVKYPDLYAIPELRSKTSETRYRLPDVCVLFHAPRTKYLLDVAFAVIEILSEDDRMTSVIEKLQEYERKGIPNIWIIDPRLQKMLVYSVGNLSEVQGDVLATRDGRLELTRAEIFQRLNG
jgi:Uma2 family endonuclease